MSGLRTACAAIIAVAGVQLTVSATAEELKLAHFMSPAHVMQTDMMAPWAEELAKATDGKLTVKIFPGRQLGGKPPTQYKLAADGIADIAFGLQGYTSSVFPRTILVELPDFGADGQQNTKRMWKLFPEYLAPEYEDVKVLAIWAGDESVIMTKTKPVRSLQDLKGLKVRTPSAMQSKLIAALGGTPIDMPVTEMYNALDRGVVDVLWVPASVIIDFKLMDVARHVTTGLPQTRSPFFLVMNKPKYDALPADLKAAIDSTTGEALSLKASAAYKRRGAKGLDAAKKAGGKVAALSPEEAARWRKAAAPMVDAAIADAEKSGTPAGEMLKSVGYRGE